MQQIPIAVRLVKIVFGPNEGFRLFTWDFTSVAEPGHLQEIRLTGKDGAVLPLPESGSNDPAANARIVALVAMLTGRTFLPMEGSSDVQVFVRKDYHYALTDPRIAPHPAA